MQHLVPDDLAPGKNVAPALTWTQVFLDFSVVAATVSFTGGTSGYFTLLFVIVILETGALMGLSQGFVFAALTAFFFVLQDLPGPDQDAIFPYWYNFLIQCLALFSTAVISGYWNQRISRLKQFQREILDNMSSGFLICSPKGQVLSINAVAQQVLQLQEDDVVGQSVEKVIICDNDMECPIITALRNERDYSSYEFPVTVGDGTTKQLGLTTNRLYDTHGRLIAIIASFSDLTEIARMRQALQRQDRLAAVGESAAELTHEIRNPLTSLRSAVEELSKNLDTPEMAKRLCQIALRESGHLNNIVSGFLDYARSPDFHKEPVNITQIFRDIQYVYAQHYPQASVVFDATEQELNIPGDLTQIRQLFDNIVRNSIEAMNYKGEIAVTIRSASHYVEIKIDDSGPGISPDKMTRIFEPFYTDKDKGIGMGLAVCLRIVTAHDGAIQVANRPGGGASFVVRLPLLQT
jgi:two-component system, NtrC family, sensor histidine kinase PilS